MWPCACLAQDCQSLAVAGVQEDCIDQDYYIFGWDEAVVAGVCV